MNKVHYMKETRELNQELSRLSNVKLSYKNELSVFSLQRFFYVSNMTVQFGLSNISEIFSHSRLDYDSGLCVLFS